MKIVNKYIILIIVSSLFAGCMQTTLKAPCNATGSNCPPKIKINQWDNND